MNVNHIKYFFDAVNENSLNRAAKLNSVTPGAVSQAIIKLEQEFRVGLLRHSKNRFELTDQGKVLYSLCPELLSSVRSLKTKMDDTVDPFKGKIYFGTQQSLASTLLPPLLSGYNLRYPQVKIDFTLGHSTHMKKLLDRREIDFTITMDNRDFGDHNKIPLFSGNFVYVCSSRSKKDLAKGFIVTGDTTEVYQLHKLYQELRGEVLPVKMRIDSWGVIKRMALEAYGIGFVPDYILTADERRYILKRPDLPQVRYGVSCVYPKNDFLNERSKSLLELFKQKA